MSNRTEIKRVNIRGREALVVVSKTILADGTAGVVFVKGGHWMDDKSALSGEDLDLAGRLI